MTIDPTTAHSKFVSINFVFDSEVVLDSIISDDDDNDDDGDA